MDINEDVDKSIHYLPMPEIPAEAWAAIAESQKKAEESTALNEVVVDPVKKALDEAVAEFEADFKERSFSGRHKDLGKMKNCAVCGRRHREAEVCVQRFAKVQVGGDPDNLRQTGPVRPKLRFGIGPGRRQKPHFSKHRLLLVQRVKEFIATHPGTEDFPNEVRDVMLQQLKRVWKRASKIYRDAQKESRTINAIS